MSPPVGFGNLPGPVSDDEIRAAGQLDGTWHAPSLGKRRRVRCPGAACWRCGIFRIALSVFREEHPKQEGETPATWLARTREAFAIEQPALSS